MSNKGPRAHYGLLTCTEKKLKVPSARACNGTACNEVYNRRHTLAHLSFRKLKRKLVKHTFKDFNQFNITVVVCQMS